jgi:molecular chaperone DnaK (HSP70)
MQFDGVVGISLGSSHISIGAIIDDSFQLLHRIPAYVAFTETDIIAGEEAKNYAVIDPQNTVYGIKQLIGISYKNAENQLSQYPFTIGYKEDKPVVQIARRNQNYQIEEIYGKLITELVKQTEKTLGVQITKAVMTVPPIFDDQQRQSTKDAGCIAGLDVIRIINEPTAACISYELNQIEWGLTTVLVFDLGVSALDLTVFEIEDGVFELMNVAQFDHLGAGRFDDAFINYVCERIGNDFKDDPIQRYQLTEACANAKNRLSEATSALIQCNGQSILITREEFDLFAHDMIKSAMIEVDSFLQRSSVSNDQIYNVVLAGGSCHIPLLQASLEERFSGKILKHIDPLEVVVRGAAIQSKVLTNYNCGTLLCIIDIEPNADPPHGYISTFSDIDEPQEEQHDGDTVEELRTTIGHLREQHNQQVKHLYDVIAELKNELAEYKGTQIEDVD